MTRGLLLGYQPRVSPGPGGEEEVAKLGAAETGPEVVRLALEQLFWSIRERIPTVTDAQIARFRHAHFGALATALEHLVRQALLPARPDHPVGECSCRECSDRSEPQDAAAALQAATGCTAEVAAEVIAKRPGNRTAQLALARLKTKTDNPPIPSPAPAQAACKLPRGYEPAGAVGCSCCGRLRPLNRRGFCAECTKRGSRMWLKGRSKFNARPQKKQ